jgi:hypothetical protein
MASRQGDIRYIPLNCSETEILYLFTENFWFNKPLVLGNRNIATFDPKNLWFFFLCAVFGCRIGVEFTAVDLFWFMQPSLWPEPWQQSSR